MISDTKIKKRVYLIGVDRTWQNGLFDKFVYSVSSGTNSINKDELMVFVGKYTYDYFETLVFVNGVFVENFNSENGYHQTISADEALAMLGYAVHGKVDFEAVTI